MSSYSSPVSGAQEDVNKPDIRNEEGGGDCANRYATHVCDTRTWSRMFGDFSAETARSLCCSSNPLERGVAFIHRSQGRRKLHKRGAWLKWAWLENPYPNPVLPPHPRCCTDSSRLQGEPSARNEGDMEAATALTGAVPAALYTVQDLLLQFFPLLLLLGQSLSCWL